MLRRAVLPIVLLAAYAYVQCAPRDPTPRSAIDEDMPRSAEHLAVPDAPRSIDELKQRIAEILEREHLAGVGIALVDRNGPIWVGGLGVRERATGAPVDADTAFRVGSLSKSVIALGVMRLVDQGKLDVDRPVREIVPDLEIDNPWEATSPVTLAQCLEHTAGLDDIRFNEIFSDDESISVRDALAINPRSRRIRWRPGTRHAYSNVGYTIAARAIEVASGEPFDVYLRREILEPMGIRDADFRRTDVLASRLASGYMYSDEPIVFRPFAHRPSAGFLASAADLAKLVHFWIMRGEGYPPIVSAAGLARIEHSGTLPYPHTDADYGFANYGDVMHPIITRGHDGGMPGFHATFRYIPDLGMGYAMLLNSSYTFRGYFEIRALLFAYLTKGRTWPPPPPARATAPPGADYFSLANPRNELFGFIDRILTGWRVADLVDHVHVAGLQGERFELVPTVDGGYRFSDECGSSVRFTTKNNGTPLMLLGFMQGDAGTSEWTARMRYAAFVLAVMLLSLAPPWAAAMLLVGALRPARRLPRSLALWPAIAGLCFEAMPRMMNRAFFEGVVGDVHPLTVALCGVSILFAVASVSTLVMALRWLTQRDRPRMRAMVIPMALGLVFTAMAIWLGMHGFVGLRTWAW